MPNKNACIKYSISYVQRRDDGIPVVIVCIHRDGALVGEAWVMGKLSDAECQTRCHSRASLLFHQVTRLHVDDVKTVEVPHA